MRIFHGLLPLVARGASQVFTPARRGAPTRAFFPRWPAATFLSYIGFTRSLLQRPGLAEARLGGTAGLSRVGATLGQGLNFALRELWARWVAFSALLQNLAFYRTSFFIYAHSGLHEAGLALSWRGWRLSWLTWLGATAGQPSLAQAFNGAAACRNSCVLVLRAPGTPVMRRLLHTAAVPTIGLSRYAGDASCYWQALPASDGAALDLQQLILSVVWAALHKACVSMSCDGLLLASFVLASLALALARSWAYIVLLALIEVAWVGLSVFWGRLAVTFLDVTWVFWATALLIFSAVELALGLFSFVALAHVTGQSRLASPARPQTPRLRG